MFDSLSDRFKFAVDRACIGIVVIAAAFALSIGLLPALAPGADSYMVGDPSNAAVLSREIEQAYIGGARRITVKAGVYNFPRSSVTESCWIIGSMRH